MATVQWLSPYPLWTTFAGESTKVRYRRPAVLRYDADTFMQDIASELAKDPATIEARLARKETWREPAAGLAPDSEALKLYQPVHLRFYLVAGSLVCRLPGLPDHRVKPEEAEKVSFVLRRVDAGQEFAWREGDQGGWMPAPPASLPDGEERLPLFPVGTATSGAGRRLFAGLVPVSRRQAYTAGKSTAAPAPGTPAEDPRKVELGQKVIGPWVQLRSWFADPDTEVQTAAEKNLIAAQSSAFLLIDTAEYLHQYLDPVWQAIQNPSLVSLLDDPGTALYNALGVQNADFGNMRLRDAMVQARSFEPQLEQMQSTRGQPPAMPSGYPLQSGASYYQLTSASFNALFSSAPAEDGTAVHPLRTLVEAALATQPPQSVAFALPQREPADASGAGLFVIRFVYERPQCGKKSPPVLSDPSRTFTMASFFDPEAPARPLQVALPIDTTPAALRKYPKNAAFMISDELQKQLSRIKSAKKLMDGELESSPSFELGFICSLSIPIITLCAFILLMIFVQLLNIVFWWLPFFKICFPIPTLKAKG
jgi:hypothetical protein